MASQMNVATNNVTSQCFYVKVLQYSYNSYTYSYSFNMKKILGIPVE